MSNFLLVEPSLSDGSLDAYFISGAGGELASAPASNLLKRQPKELFETVNAGSTIEARFDLGTSGLPVSYDFIALFFANAETTATVTFSGSTSSTFGSTAWTSIAIGPAAGQTTYARKHFFYVIPSTQTARYVRFLYSDIGNPDGAYRLGRFYCGKAYRPTVNVTYGLTQGFEEEVAATITTAGERITRATEAAPVLTFTLQAMGSGAKDEFYTNVHELMRRRGSSRDVVCIVDPNDTSHVGRGIYYGTLQTRQQIELPQFDYYTASFELRGMI